MEPSPLDRMWNRGSSSLRERWNRLVTKRFHILQCSIAAGLAWLVAAEMFHKQTPYIAPIAAVVALGTSYSQRVRRVIEVAFGVAVGVLVADLLALWLGTGWWQLIIIVGLAMSAALLLDGGPLLVTQAAVQSIVVTTLIPDPGQGLTRWTDALIGGGVALVAASIAPATPLRRPREQAARVMRKISQLLDAASEVMLNGEVEHGLDLLAKARDTDHLIQELRAAADEGMSVVVSSPFRGRHRDSLKRVAELVDPLDRALRSTRVLVRQVAITAYHRRPVPAGYAMIATDLAAAAEQIADEMAQDRMAVAARPALLAVGQATGVVERTEVLTAEVILAQLRSIVADLLMLTGLDQLESTDALPPPRGMNR